MEGKEFSDVHVMKTGTVQWTVSITRFMSALFTEHLSASYVFLLVEFFLVSV